MTQLETYPDPIDRASALAEAEREEAAARRLPVPPCTGHCYNCEAPALPGRRFCDGDCERDYLRRVWAQSQRPYRYG